MLKQCLRTEGLYGTAASYIIIHKHKMSKNSLFLQYSFIYTARNVLPNSLLFVCKALWRWEKEQAGVIDEAIEHEIICSMSKHYFLLRDNFYCFSEDVGLYCPFVWVQCALVLAEVLLLQWSLCNTKTRNSNCKKWCHSSQ